MTSRVLSLGTSFLRMNFMVFVPFTLVPTPWARRPNSFAADLLHSFLYLGSRRSWRYLSSLPVSLSRTAIASCTSFSILVMRLMRRRACLLGLERRLLRNSSTAAAMWVGSLLDLVLAAGGPALARVFMAGLLAGATTGDLARPVADLLAFADLFFFVERLGLDCLAGVTDEVCLVPAFFTPVFFADCWSTFTLGGCCGLALAFDLEFLDRLPSTLGGDCFFSAGCDVLSTLGSPPILFWIRCMARVTRRKGSAGSEGSVGGALDVDSGVEVVASVALLLFCSTTLLVACINFSRSSRSASFSALLKLRTVLMHVAMALTSLSACVIVGFVMSLC